MKNLLLTSVLAGALLFHSETKAQLGFSLNVHLGNRPDWSASVRENANYFYLPEIDCYYDIAQRQFVYENEGRWVFDANLPYAYRNYDLYNGYKIAVNEPRPYMRGDFYRNQYRERYNNYNRGREVYARNDRRFDNRYDNRYDNRGFNEQRMNDQRFNEQRMNQQRMNDQRMNEQRFNDQRRNDSRMNDQRMNEQRMNNPRMGDQRMNDQRMNDQRLNDQRSNNNGNNGNNNNRSAQPQGGQDHDPGFDSRSDNRNNGYTPGQVRVAQRRG